MMDGDAAVELRIMRSAWRALCRDWELDAREVRGILDGGDADAERLSVTAETRMRILIAIGHRLEPRRRDDLADELRLANPVFNLLSPIEAMSGDLRELRMVRRMVESGAWS